MSVKDDIVKEVLAFCEKESLKVITRETVDEYIESYADELLVDATDDAILKLQDHDIEVED